MTAERVIAVFARLRRVESEEIGPASSFSELGMDSLDALEALFELEEEFGVEIPNELAEGFLTVGEVIDGIERLLDGTGETPAGPEPTGLR
jgi:acyl carrier protein